MKIVANSTAMSRAIETLRILGRSSGPILLIGKRGAGKNTLAQYIHELQGRSSFVPVDCCESHDTLEKLLLGNYDPLHVDDIWDPDTPAYQRGRIELAADGTLYLDRIDLAPKKSVPLLINVLNGIPFRPLNSSYLLEPNNVLCVASCAPHPFGESALTYLDPRLYAAFKGRVVMLPDLRERDDDLAALIGHFAEDINPAVHLELGEAFLAILAQHDWSGNLSELRTLTRQIVHKVSQGANLTPEMGRNLLRRVSAYRMEPRERERQARCGTLAEGIVYRNRPVTGEMIYAWISQFDDYRSLSNVNPRDIAEDLIRAVCGRYFYSEARLENLLQVLYEQLMQRLRNDSYWIKVLQRQSTQDADRMLQKRIIVTNPLGLMKSPDVILPIFRSVTGLSPTRNTVQFDQLAEHLTRDKGGFTVVIVDDFIGSGSQFESKVLGRIVSDAALCRVLQDQHREPIHFYMIVCVAYQLGLCRAQNAVLRYPWLKLSILAHDVLRSEHLAFDTASSVYPDDRVREEAQALLVERIGRHLTSDVQTPWSQMQGLVVFAHNTPNNTLPVVWKNGFVDEKPWTPIFPRMAAG